VSMALEAHGLGKRYKRNWALKDCSLHVPAGRVAALVGPNGAGKSTLLNLAVGLLHPTEGELHVLGRSLYGDRDLLDRVGFVAQDTPLYPDFTVAELITMGARLNRRWDTPLARDRCPPTCSATWSGSATT
jgi:ABC-2 type transport system ATP-binding protein